MFFSKTNGAFSSTGVVAVTQIVFRESDGEILEADIILNDNYAFSSDQLRSNYLGNAITHELGHVAGLGHGQVKGSSMFFELAPGQHTIHADDEHGLKSLYGVNEGKGTLRGKVVGNKSQMPILGSHVQLISRAKSKVVAGAITDQNGNFAFNNLSVNDEYFIYFGPAKAVKTLNDYYRGARNDFCYGRTSYRGNFYKSCHASQQGMPDVIKFNNTLDLDVGPMTIYCDMDVPSAYLNTKGSTYIPELNFQQNSNYAHVGYFSKEDVLISENDNLKIDLSNLPLPSGAYYLEISILSHEFYSATKLAATATRDGNTYNAPLLVDGVARDSDNTPRFDVFLRIPLNTSNPAKNIVNVTISPDDLLDYAESFLAGFGPDEYFPSKDNFLDPYYFYFLSATIVKQTGIDTYENQYFKNGLNKADSALCQGAPLAYSVAVTNATKVNLPTKTQENVDPSPLSCATINLDINNNHPGGGSNGAIGLVVTLLVGVFLGVRPRIIR